MVDENGREVPPNTPGEVLLRGANMMKEYWNQPEATAEALRDGWLYTGDVAVMDATIQVNISGGENVYPAEIENVVLGHPNVIDCAVIGMPSKRWGESPLVVAVRANETVDEAAILNHCDGKLARFKQPKGVVFIDAIPRNPSGKALKFESSPIPRRNRAGDKAAVTGPSSDVMCARRTKRRRRAMLPRAPGAREPPGQWIYRSSEPAVACLEDRPCPFAFPTICQRRRFCARKVWW